MIAYLRLRFARLQQTSVVTGPLLGLMILACERPVEEKGADAAIELSRMPEMQFVEAVRIDAASADLVPIDWLGVSPNGSLVVMQALDHAIKVFSPSGQLVTSVGSKGSGPGEFQRPTRGGWVKDTLWISDTQLFRLTLVTESGSIVRLIPPLTNIRPAIADNKFPEIVLATPFAVYPGDTILVLGFASATDSRAPAFGRSALLRVSNDGLIDHLVMVPPTDDNAAITYRGTNGEYGTTIPFYPAPLWRVSADGARIVTVTVTFADSRSGTFTVTSLNAHGDILFSRSYPFVGAEQSAAAIDSAIMARAKRAPGSAIREWLMTELRSRVPAVQPPIGDLVIGSDYRIWLALPATAAGRPWLALSPTGLPVGRITLPPSSQLRAADADEVWVTERDDADLESIVKYRITKTQAAAGSLQL
jgi:hypothetical protein